MFRKSLSHYKNYEMLLVKGNTPSDTNANNYCHWFEILGDEIWNAQQDEIIGRYRETETGDVLQKRDFWRFMGGDEDISWNRIANAISQQQ